MANSMLSGIERELVLKYLIDGNVPVTVTPFSEESDDNSEEIKPLSSAVFPVALKAGQINVLKEGIILLQNAPKNIGQFIGRKVKVEFYFNRVGLYFISEMKSVSAGAALVIPSEIQRIEEVEVHQKYDFSSVINLTSNGKSGSFDCFPAAGFKLFVRPVWSSIQLENQEKAKKYLEKFVEQAKESGRAGNGIQLVNICRYIAEEKVEQIQALQGRVKPFDILFINHERIVLGFSKNEAVTLETAREYDLTMKFSLRATPLITRDIKVTVRADILYSNDENNKFVADCTFTKILEEDTRFLYEKATSLLFI